MNAFTAAAAALLSRYSENLLREECESALSGNLVGTLTSASSWTNVAIFLINSFTDKGIYFKSFLAFLKNRELTFFFYFKICFKVFFIH